MSRFLLEVENGDIIALVHQLKPRPMYLSKESWLKLRSEINAGEKSSNAVVADLMDLGLVVDDPSADIKALQETRAYASDLLDRPTILYLMMAQGCNFACTYCPIPGLAKRYGENLLSLEDAVAGISFWEKQIVQHTDNDPYFIIFYGGEPLLNRKVLEQLLPVIVEERKAGRLPKNLELMLCTNGLLLDESLSKLLARYEVTVAVGIDGPQAHNDRIRITSEGEPTFIIIKSAIERLLSDGVRVVASVMITPQNVDYLSEYPDFLLGLDIDQFGFNLMKGEALLKELHGRSIEDYSKAAAAGVLKGLGRSRAGGESYEYQLEKKLGVLQGNLPFVADCTCYGNQLVVNADGQVSNCPFLRCDEGGIRGLSDTFRISRTENVGFWRRRLPVFNEDLLVKRQGTFLDGGGCAWSSNETGGSIAAEDTINRIFTEGGMYGLVWNALPAERAEAIQRGETSHWIHRRIRVD